MPPEVQTATTVLNTERGLACPLNSPQMARPVIGITGIPAVPSTAVVASAASAADVVQPRVRIQNVPASHTPGPGRRLHVLDDLHGQHPPELCPRILREISSVPVGLARRRRALEAVEKILTTQVGLDKVGEVTGGEVTLVSEASASVSTMPTSADS